MGGAAGPAFIAFERPPMHSVPLLVTPRSSYPMPAGMPAAPAVPYRSDRDFRETPQRDVVLMIARRGSYADESDMRLPEIDHRPEPSANGLRSIQAGCYYGDDREEMWAGALPDVMIWAESLRRSWRDQGRPDIADRIVVRPR